MFAESENEFDGIRTSDLHESPICPKQHWKLTTESLSEGIKNGRYGFIAYMLLTIDSKTLHQSKRPAYSLKHVDLGQCRANHVGLVHLAPKSW